MAGRSKKLPQLSFIFTPSGFICDVRCDEDGKPTSLAQESLPWYEKFSQDRIGALYDLGFAEPQSWYTPSMRFLYRVADTFLRFTVQQADIELLREKARPVLAESDKAALLLAVPFSPGAEYVNAAWIDQVNEELSATYAEELSKWEGSVEQYVSERTQNLRVPERIFFHLVENVREDREAYPFAFVATYAESEGDAVNHHPLRFALEEYEDDPKKLLSLIAGLSAAANKSELLSRLMESGELFHPLRLTTEEAYSFLMDVPLFEEAGILCRVPNWWKRGSSKVKANVRIGESGPEGIGAGALVKLTPSFEADGQELTREEIERLLTEAEGLSIIKGKWVEIDHERLQKLLAAFDEAESQSMSIFEAMRAAASEEAEDDLVEVTRGEWLDGLLSRMKSPAQLDSYVVPESIDATLRPYQKVGFSWLSYLNELGFGACLADDMGLGKTLQMITFVERLRVQSQGKARVLLVVPASLVGNWQRELEKFAHDLDCLTLYGTSANKMNEQWADVADGELRDKLPTLCITTYAMAQKIEIVSRMVWDVLVLDEAQAIKNPNVKQTRSLKAVSSNMRIALTGTPVENDLSNLWSVFDFLNPGMLGTLKEFKKYTSELEQETSGYAPLRNMISPFLLRRLKTDRSIISDLPDKYEINQYVKLSRKQVVLYRKVVNELEEALKTGDDQFSTIKRQGLVLATIMKLKQICNHPDQYLGQGGFSLADSGKFQMLAELSETIYEKRERVIVFTQFREMCEPLSRLLEGVFGRPGCVIHGQVPAKTRTKLVERFQGEEYVPFMVLSLKAGGTGLNLTAANNVIHFDRWWNPAVENQATDRAFRIGQTKDVMVHKMVCEDTLEERIDQIIQGKSELVDQVVGEGETWIGNLNDDQLVELLSFGSRR